MNQNDLIEAFEAGDIGQIEFFELALETELTMEQIELVLARVGDDS